MRFILKQANNNDDIDCRSNGWTLCYIRRYNSQKSMFYSTGITHTLSNLIMNYTTATIKHKVDCDRKKVLCLVLSGVLI